MLTFCNGHALHGHLTKLLRVMTSRKARSHRPEVKRILLAMKITAFILLVFSLHVTAKSVSQTITLKGRDLPLTIVFAEIEKQSGYVVVYNQELIKGVSLVSVDVKDEPLLEFLDATLTSRGLSYVLENKTIMLKKHTLSAHLTPQQLTPLKTTFPISGVVKGVDGKPLANVSVVVRGTNKGTTTDAEGKFNIDVNPGEVLVVSSVGFGVKEVKVSTANSNLVIALDISSSPMDEVQVIAYGETSKRLNTGNVVTIKAADIQKQPVSNPLLAVQGRVPGIFISQATGLPGSGVTVRIQGVNSINSGNDPLYVIDGVPYRPQLLQTINGIVGSSGINGVYGNPLNFIALSDIESIDILKDADATSIYGSRAANGAILITTKRGNAGRRSRFDVKINSGQGMVARKLDVLNTPQYLAMRQEALQNEGFAAPAPTDFDINGVWDLNKSTDWQKVLIGGRSNYTDIHSSVSGGTEQLQFLLGAGYKKETTVYPHDFSDQKMSFHVNVNHASLNKKLKLTFSGQYLYDYNQLPNIDLTAAAIALPPNAPDLEINGKINWAPDEQGNTMWGFVGNPIAVVYNRYKNRTRNLIANTNISYELLSGLQLKTSFGYTNLQSDETQVLPFIAVAPEQRPFTSRASLTGNNLASGWIIEPQANYHHKIGEGSLQVLVGATFQRNNARVLQLLASGYSSDEVLEDLATASQVNVNYSDKSLYKYNAVFGRINYNWMDKYILNLTGRRDGSSRFGAENLYHPFWSVASAWIFSKESYLQNFPTLSFGKIRASFGTTGNDQIGDYRFLDLYNPTFAPVRYQGITGIVPFRLANPFLQWEETKKFQAGVDLGFFSDKVILSVNYFLNRSSNQLLEYTLPQMTGFSSISSNFPALVQNSGFEIAFNISKQKIGSVHWSTGLNVTLPKNKLMRFSNIESSAYANRLVIGQPVTIKKVYRFLGVDPSSGEYLVADSKGQPTLLPDFHTDRTTIIDVDPKFYGGWQNNFTYKNISVDFLFQVVKQKGENYLLGNLPGYAYGPFGNQPAWVLQRWQKPGDVTNIQQFDYDASLIQQASNALTSDIIYSDASFIRLKHVSVSWRLPERIPGNPTLFLQSQNILTISKYNGLDPETKSSTSLPPLRIITAGVQCSF